MIERYVADRSHELYGTCREHDKQIREEERFRSEGEKTEEDTRERANSCE